MASGEVRPHVNNVLHVVVGDEEAKFVALMLGRSRDEYLALTIH